MSAVVAPRPDAPQTLRNLGAQLTSLWLPAVAWRLARCGRSGLIGLALLGASAVFLLSTLLPTLDEVRRLRVDLIDAKTHAAKTPPHGVSAPAREFGSLPVRTDIPQVLGVLLKQADELIPASVGTQDSMNENDRWRLGRLSCAHRCLDLHAISA